MRWALARVALAVTSMVALAFLIPLGFAIDHIAAQRALADAQARIAAIEPVLAVTTDRTQLEGALATMSGAQDIALQLPGEAALGTSHASAAQLAAVAAQGRAQTLAVPGGSVLVQPELVDGGRLTLIEVFIDAGRTRQGVARGWLILSAVALVLVAGSTLVADRLATRVVGAARHLAEASRKLGDGDTAVRVTTGGPNELREAGDAFNAMADRVVQLLAAERELVADLSHRLRTPLTALRLNAQALGDGPSAASTREAVAKLEQEVDQIIRAARGGTAASGSCDVAAVVAERMAFWSALAEDQERPWQLVGAAGPAHVPVTAAELAAALDAVLGNVFRHTPEGTAFQVTVHRGNGSVAVLVDDAGPGLADAARAVRRGEGSGRTGSTGLGLDIVRKLAERTGGSLTIDRSPLGGAQVHFSFLAPSSNAVTAPGSPAGRTRRYARRARA
ncbi:HAMP domain-containing histidine kinase [Actinocrinis puniceicyclus]|uniref:Signal transduction histidine-protein kinase/phosphatase MprB n=1 Tax=Actinocrinis puniceicyclus TaxID=977794 RepID=A0A8J7WKS6_9ACTN|nr:HAMP domain-containing sensor histidine kinase [Actinocrinis puniceicyclus]MBS2964121.1 HAMP domain-containing histidine kinase [Actinocrinis puniceicyclus]